MRQHGKIIVVNQDRINPNQNVGWEEGWQGPNETTPSAPWPSSRIVGTSQQRYVKFRGAGEASGVLLYHCTVSQSLVCETRGNVIFRSRLHWLIRESGSL